MRFLRILAALIVTSLAGIWTATSIFVGGYYYVEPELPDAAELRNLEFRTPLRVYSRDGRLIGRFGAEIRFPVAYEEIPDVMIKALLAAEDDQFFEHPGFDYIATVRAALNVFLSGGSLDVAGGSTITQQLARQYFLNRELSLVRKFKELIMAVRIEREFAKQEILGLYLNTYFFGQNSYGVAAAAQTYFDKELNQLSISDAAIIAGIAQGPSIWNPVYSRENAAARRSYVLRRMLELGDITQEEHDWAAAEPIDGVEHGPQIELEAPWVAEMVRVEMLERFGPRAQTDGFRVTSTIDSRLQRAANAAVKNALLAYDRRHGYRGPIAQLPDSLQPAEFEADAGESEIEAVMTTEREAAWREALAGFGPVLGMQPALVVAVGENAAQVYVQDAGLKRIGLESVAWAAAYIDDDRVGPEPETVDQVLTVGDVVRFSMTVDGAWTLAQVPQVQGALASLDPADGAVSALVGGLDYGLSVFNRAAQSRRQPGSAFKPFIYSAALENGFTTATIVNDAPVVIESAELEGEWRPQNYDGRWYGETRLREALVESLNSVAVRVIRQVGIGNTVRHLRNFGFEEAALPRNAALALGAGVLAPIDLAGGYAVLANGGYRVQPYYIDRVESADGEELFSADRDLRLACIEYSRPAPNFNGSFAQAADTDPQLCQSPGREDAFQGNASNPEALPAEVAEGEESVAYVTADESESRAFRPAAIDYSSRLAPRVVSEQNVYLVADMMRDVVRRGSGARAWRQLRRSDLSGKTGTASEERDTWFSGFNSGVVATAWVGFDDNRRLGRGEQGGVTAIPIWIDFMAEALAGQPANERRQPPGIVEVRINPENGLAASDLNPDAIFEKFRIGHIPEREPDPIYAPPRIESTDEERPRSGGGRIF